MRSDFGNSRWVFLGLAITLVLAIGSAEAGSNSKAEISKDSVGGILFSSEQETQGLGREKNLVEMDSLENGFSISRGSSRHSWGELVEVVRNALSSSSFSKIQSVNLEVIQAAAVSILARAFDVLETYQWTSPVTDQVHILRLEPFLMPSMNGTTYGASLALGF